jgi:hypothetical protein
MNTLYSGGQRINLAVFYQQLELAIQYKLDVSSIPNEEVQELFDNLNDLINSAREAENKDADKKTLKTSKK